MSVLSWWNLIFVLPALAAVLYLILLATGTVGDHSTDVDADIDGDLHLDGDVHLDGDLHVGDVHVGDVHAGDVHGIEHAFSTAHAADGTTEHPGGWLHILSLFGVGRAPLSLLMISIFLLWGFFGWVGNSIFSTLIASPALFIWPSIALALVGSLFLTRLLANGLHRVMPATETYAVSNRQLVGRLASVRYAVSATGGTAQLYDDRGRMHEVPVRVLPGEDPIPAQSQVVLWRYDPRANAYLVTPESDLTELTEAPARRLLAHEEANER